MTTANIVPTPETGGLPYGTAVALTALEAGLGDGLRVPDPIAVESGLAIVAVVQLAMTGGISSSVYVVMQTDMGDGAWVDVAWFVATFTPSTAGNSTFVLCGGGVGAVNNAFQQLRAANSPPASSGSNTMPLGGRVRFVGKATSPTVTATIRYKLINPR